MLKMQFREPRVISENLVAKLEIPRNGILICLFNPDHSMGAALVVDSSFSHEDKKAIKDLFLDFKNKLPYLELNKIEAKIVGPTASTKSIEKIFESSGIQIKAISEIEKMVEAEAIFYPTSGRLRVARNQTGN